MILKNESGTIKFGLFMIFILVGVFGIWIGLAPLASAAVAVGKVSVVDNKKVIQHLEGGVVDKIFIKDGSKVKKGDALIELSNIRLESEIGIIKKDFLLASALTSRLEAQRDNENSINFSKDIMDFDDFLDIKTSQENIFYEQKKLFDSEMDIFNQRISQLNKQIQGTKAILNAKENRIKSVKDEIKEWERLFREQLTDKIHLRDLKRERVALDGEIAANEADIAKLNIQITETRSQMIAKERSYKEEILKRLQDARAKLVDAQQRYKALQDQSKRTIIRSPVDGTIVELAVHTIGGVVRSGEKIMSVIPSDTNYVIDAKLQINDIDSVYTGLLADLRFSAFNSNQSKVIEGKVTYISADSLTDQRGFNYYELKAELTPQGIKDLQDNNFFLLPGMPAEVMIKTGERTVISYILKPFTDMFKRAFNEE